MQVDYLIVGQGIAGSIFSYILLKNRKSVIVVNKTSESSSSRRAAGIYNPITGKEMGKTWNADNLFPGLEGFYSEMEEKIEGKFLFRKPIYRPFLSVEEQNEWMARSSLDVYKNYIKAIYRGPRFDNIVKDDFGGMELNWSGYVDTIALLNSYKKYLIKKNAYFEDVFRPELLEFHATYIRYKDIRARKIILCLGPEDRSGYFEWLPYNLVKGETLLVEVEKEIPTIINRGVFILPLKERICKVGATYEWDDLSTEPTIKAREELVEKLSELLKISYKVVDQTAGIRPSSRDRRPYLGLHPENKLIGLFNGLGTKGVSLAPYFAQQFFDCLENQKELSKEVDIFRHNSLYFNKKTNNG